MTAKNTAYKSIGKLAALGMTRLAQAPLYLPAGHDDFTQIAESPGTFTDSDTPFAMYLTLRSTPKGYFNGAPRLVLNVTTDDDTPYRVTIFGNTKDWTQTLAGVTRACFLMTAKTWNDNIELNVIEIVLEAWTGRLRPRYAGRPRVMAAESVREAILDALPRALPDTAAFVATQLACFGPIADLLTDVGASGWSLKQIIHQVHLPVSHAHAAHARLVFMRLVALMTMRRLHGEASDVRGNPIAIPSLDLRIAGLKFKLTSDQLAAVTAIGKAIGAPDRPGRVAVVGEPGTGKTSVACVVAVAVADDHPRRRVAILTPNSILAGQMLDELLDHFPDADAQLVVGESPTSTDLDHQILVGTSAILFRGDQIPFDLVIVDELHRWSRSQREQLVSSGTHLVEMSATPIPRTQALIRYGRFVLCELRETHRPKLITTTLHEGREGLRDMFDAVAPSIRSGDVLLVVYPRREASAQNQEQDLAGEVPTTDIDPDDRNSVEFARQRWEKLYPGKVRTLTSDDDTETKSRVLSDIANRRAQILLCTTVVEVGVNLPNLYRIVIVCPERHGLMGLHQLRGRVARQGGDGFCHLYSPEPLKERQRSRLEYFARTSSGFDLAEFDLHQRGAGDLAPDSDRQSGDDQTFLFGTNLDLKYMDDIMPIWEWTQGLMPA